ncbi:MAG: hypothetical protein R2857_09105 [Vampirovibrionales bacterium]
MAFSAAGAGCLTQAGMSREEAYRLVQAYAHEAWLANDGHFRRAIEADYSLPVAWTKKPWPTALTNNA